jgi:hypothetical protein
LEQHHHTFRTGEVCIDYACFAELPENGLVHDQCRTIDVQDRMEIPADASPPEKDDRNPGDHGEGLYSKGFVPNLQTGMTELQHLQQATNTAHAGPYILTSDVMAWLGLKATA